MPVVTESLVASSSAPVNAEGTGRWVDEVDGVEESCVMLLEVLDSPTQEESGIGLEPVGVGEAGELQDLLEPLQEMIKSFLEVPGEEIPSVSGGLMMVEKDLHGQVPGPLGSGPGLLQLHQVEDEVYRVCEVPNCDDNSTNYMEIFTEWAIPEGDQCHVWTIKNNITDQCQPDVFSNTTTSCSQWVYDTSLFSATTVTQYDLTCEKAWLRPLAGSMYMTGMLVGAIVIGDLADRFGRKIGILVSALLLGTGGVLSTVPSNYYIFLLMRFFSGAGGNGLLLVTFVLAVELIGAKWRTFCGIITHISFSLGGAMTGVLAIFIRDWRWLQVAVTAPAFLLTSYTCMKCSYNVVICYSSD
nr:organic cation transporter-like protein [Cherax quadricarinatus]